MMMMMKMMMMMMMMMLMFMNTEWMFERWKWWRGCRSIWNRTGWRRNDATGAGRLPFTWPPGPGTPPLSPYSSHTALTSPPRSAPSSSFHYAYPPFSFHSPSILLPFSFHSPTYLFHTSLLFSLTNYRTCYGFSFSFMCKNIYENHKELIHLPD